MTKLVLLICSHVSSVCRQDFQVRADYRNQILAMIMLLVTFLLAACSHISLPSSKRLRPFDTEILITLSSVVHLLMQLILFRHIFLFLVAAFNTSFCNLFAAFSNLFFFGLDS